MHVVVKTINIVRKQGLNQREFQQLLLEMDAEYGDMLYYCEVRWLSRGARFHRVYVLHNVLAVFRAQMGFGVPELSDSAWLSDLALLVDVSKHLNVLNIKLQGRNKLINKLFEHFCAFQ